MAGKIDKVSGNFREFDAKETKTTLTTGGILTTTTIGDLTSYEWEGTLSQYEAGIAANAIPTDCICYITDDETELTTNAIPDSTDRRYMTEAQKSALDTLISTGYKTADAFNDWNYDYYSVVNNGTWASNTLYTYDLSSKLTDPNATYECIFGATASSSTGVGNTFFRFGNNKNTESAIMASGNGMPSGGCFTVPVKGQSVAIMNYGAQQNNTYLTLRAYRKYKV